MPFEHELAVALEAAAIAGGFIRKEYETFVPIPDAPVSISTHVDSGSQEMILKHLHAAFPADGLCAEESTISKPDGPQTTSRVWVVDPIDGTRGFAMKNGEFSVMIGLTVDRIPVVGVVLEPVTMTYTYATVGGGCWMKRGDQLAKRCRVRTEGDPKKCIFVQSHSKPGIPSAASLAVRPAEVREMYSAGVKLAVVARGEADVYVNTYPNFYDWDICAGHILVTEAGGVVSGLSGAMTTYGGATYAQKDGLIASNGALHEEVVQLLARSAN